MIIDREDWSFRGKLHGEINDQIATLTENICSGTCSPEHYKFLAGKLSAFGEVLAISKAIVAAQEGRDSTET